MSAALAATAKMGEIYHGFHRLHDIKAYVDGKDAASKEAGVAPYGVLSFWGYSTDGHKAGGLFFDNSNQIDNLMVDLRRLYNEMLEIERERSLIQ